MSSRIRPARPSDLDALFAIARLRPTSAGWSQDSYRKEISSPRSYFAVLEEGGVIRGYALSLKVPPETQLVDLAVRIEDEGRGWGRALLEHVAEQARNWGYERMTLEVSAQNEPALRLYRGMGFEVVGRRAKFYNDGSDAILMDLRL